MFYRIALASFLSLVVGGNANALPPRGGTGTSGAPAPIAPSAIPGLQVDLNPDVGCVKVGSGACGNGDSVASLADQSGQGHDSTTLSGTVSYLTNARNGHNALVCGAPGYMSQTWLGEPGTIVVVYYTANWAAGVGQALLGADTSDAVAVGAYQLEPYGINKYGYSNYQRITTAESTNAAPAAWTSRMSHTLSLWEILGVENDGSVITQRKSEFAAPPVTKPANTVRPISAAIICGEFYNRARVSPFNGYIARILMYDNKISDANYSGLIQYLKNTYDMNPTGGFLMSATQGGASSGGAPHQAYGDQSLYLLRGSDGHTFPYVQPTNFLCGPGPGKAVFGVVQFSILKDQDGNVIKSNDGYFWGELSRNALWTADAVTTPYTTIDIASSPDLFNWSCEASFNFGTGGLNIVSGANAEGFNDGWFQDNGNGNIYAKFNAGNSLAQTAQQEYSLQITNLQHGRVTFAGSATQTAGTALATGMYSSYTALVSGTYCMIWNRTDASTNQGNVATSSAALTGYNSSSLITGGTHAEWGQIITLGAGSTLMYQDLEGKGMQYQTATDSCLASPGGFASVSNPTTNSVTFVPQGGYVVHTPAGF